MRAEKIKLKNRKERTASSRQWLVRQLNDPYVKQSKQDGYRSRAAYKLIEIADKYGLFKPGQTVVDLGAAPGGWSQVVVDRLKPNHSPQSAIVAIDLLPMAAIPHVNILEGDFEACEEVLAALLPNGADVILSDIAPPACGIQQVDHIRIMGLAESVIAFAYDQLKPGGALVVKVLRGGTEIQLLNAVKKAFTKVAHFKPHSSRQDSREMYLIALGYRGKSVTSDMDTRLTT
jgi:23S rRNA (uridine2552-2'-O)-methyltransferase